jgi:hypothetical protein
VGGCVAGDGTHNPPIIRENQAPEQMFCALRLANPYRIDRHSYSAICLDPPPGELAEPITLRDKLACVWKQLLAAPSQISVAVDLRSMTK